MTKSSIATVTLITISTLLFTPASIAATENQQIITFDGREVLLNKDGTWKYLSTDRFANTKDGTRIRLKEDGSWQAMGNTLSTSKDQVRTTDLDIKLQKIVIETYKKKSQKSTRVKTQTVFYIDLRYSAQAKKNISIQKSDLSLIEVKDNNGKTYPVLSIEPDTSQFKPGTGTTLVVRADKSPSLWDNVRSMEIVFKTGILGIEAPVTLSQKTNDFVEVNVDGFR